MHWDLLEPMEMRLIAAINGNQTARFPIASGKHMRLAYVSHSADDLIDYTNRLSIAFNCVCCASKQKAVIDSPQISYNLANKEMYSVGGTRV